MEIKVRNLGEKGSFKYGFDQSWNCYWQNRSHDAKVQIPVTDKLSTDQVQANIKLEEQPVDAETLKDCFINTVPDKLSVDRAEAYTKSEIEKDGGGSTLKVIKEDDNHRHSRLAVATDSYGLKDLYGYGIAEEKAESYANRLDHVLLLFLPILFFKLNHICCCLLHICVSNFI